METTQRKSTAEQANKWKSKKELSTGTVPKQHEDLEKESNKHTVKKDYFESMFKPEESNLQEQLLEKYLTQTYTQYFVEDKRVRNCPPSKEELKNQFSEYRIPEQPVDPSVYFKNLSESVLSKTTHCGSPMMIGHMTTSLPFFQRPLSKMVTAINQNTVKLETSSYVTFLERETLAKLHHAFFKLDKSFYTTHIHNPESSLGTFTSGGTLANLTALWAARNIALGPTATFGGVEKEGLFQALKHYGYEGACIIGSEMVHYSFKKATDMLGLGTSGLVTIPINERYCMRTELLASKIQELEEKKIKVLAVVGVVGATETGSIDNLKAIATICKKHQIHFHVDAAWGGPMVFSSRLGDRIKGVELADSVTVDGHKQFYTPMGCGIVLFRDPATALGIRKTANYIIRIDSLDLGKFSPEGSRPAVAIYLHAVFNILGAKGLENLMNHGCDMVEYMRKKVKASSDFEVVCEPMMNILLYRWIPKEFSEKFKNNKLTKEDNDKITERNQQLQKILNQQGNSFVSRTTVNSIKYGTPISVLRVVITNPLTTTEHIDFALNEQLKFIALLQN